MSEWVTDKDALLTILTLNALQPGDEVLIQGESEHARNWNDAIVRILPEGQCLCIESPNDLGLKGRQYSWPNGNGPAYLTKIVIGWRRPHE